MPLDPRHREAIARELEALAAEIELIGAELCADAAVVARHITMLQSIDSIRQRQQALANLIVADDLPEALADCTMERITDLFA